MWKRFFRKTSRLNRWARGIGKLAAETEMNIMDAKAEFEAKIRRFRGLQRKA
jgi:hypothetical protein